MYDQIFVRYYDIEVEDFLRVDFAEYDLVILSSLLHLEGVKPRWKEILAGAIQKLRFGGYVYVSVFDTDQGYGHFESAELKEFFSLMKVERTDTNVGKKRQYRLLGKRDK